MAKTVPTKTRFRITKKNWVMVVVLAVGLGLVGYVAIYPLVAEKIEKDHFLKAQSTLEKLSQQIQAKLGPANQSETEDSCSYQSLKFSRGALSCSIKISMRYEKRNVEQANMMMKDTASLFQGNIQGNTYDSFGQKNTTNTFVTPDLNHRGDQMFSQSITALYGLGCGTQYLYPVTQDRLDPYVQRFDEVFTIQIYCSDFARAEYFPVKN